MKILLKLILLLSVALSTVQADDKSEKVPWTDPDLAAKEHPDFLLQGEYVGKLDGVEVALQITSLDKGRFLMLTYRGGLPGAGWDKGDLKSELVDLLTLKARTKSLKRIERKSPSLGKKPPEGAIVIFAGKANKHIKGEIKDGLLWAGSETVTEVGDFHMHLEFRLPFKPWRMPSSQDRGNSGVYLFNNFEIQVLDSFALDLRSENNAIKLESLNTQWCGSFYKQKLPDVPMAFPPLVWQTYDIDFVAPQFGSDGMKTSNARVTVRQNGVLIHDDVEMEKGTGGGAKRPQKSRGRIFFQGHGNPIAYRNIWMLEK